MGGWVGGCVSECVTPMLSFPVINSPGRLHISPCVGSSTPGIDTSSNSIIFV